MPALLLLRLATAPAWAEDTNPGGLRGVDLGLWILLLGVLFVALVGWRRAVRWADDELEPTLREVRGVTANLRPPRLYPITDVVEGPSLLGERWLKPGGLHLVLAERPQPVLPLVAEVLEDPRCVVAVASEHVRPDTLAHGLSAEAAARVLWSPDAPNEAMLAALSVRGRPVVVFLDAPPDATLLPALARWDAIGVLVHAKDPGLAGLVDMRRVS